MSGGQVFRVIVKFILLPLALIACLLLVVANILVLIRISPGANTVDQVMQIILRIYNIGFALVLAVAVFENQFVVRNIQFLGDWIGFGFSLIFLGVLTLASVGATTLDTSDYTAIIRLIAGWMAVGMGVIFFLLGCFGFRKYYKEQEAAAKAASAAKA
eukprot:Unigene4620_Nuclearia_a/m.14103 Unigene4620_Nuclearia_a/g.14103  ORF Unigene4620_Nuclearia_a/g.14103 Unigene4620_Nuclearia_a/m.14103 type:complete len:158 (+) Unigene4620_Nuclearia_a:106-579(+)